MKKKLLVSKLMTLYENTITVIIVFWLSLKVLKIPSTQVLFQFSLYNSIFLCLTMKNFKINSDINLITSKFTYFHVIESSILLCKTYFLITILYF